MKITILSLFVLCSLQLCSTAETLLPAGTFDFREMTPRMILPIYKEMTGLELEIDPAVKQATYGITATTEKPMTKAEAIKLMEKAMAEQAGILVTRLDDKHASVTYHPELRKLTAKKPAFVERPRTAVSATNVLKDSVRLTGAETDPTQYVAFKYVGKNSKQVKQVTDLKFSVIITRQKKVVARANSCEPLIEEKTNYVGLVLGFTNRVEAQLAEKTLRGD